MISDIPNEPNSKPPARNDLSSDQRAALTALLRTLNDTGVNDTGVYDAWSIVDAEIQARLQSVYWRVHPENGVNGSVNHKRSRHFAPHLDY